MLDQAQIIRVLIASPSDLESEREGIPSLFVLWNNAHEDVQLAPIMWETASVPALGEHPQRAINRQLIEKADLLVALFWTKIGSPTLDAPSGTIDEIREFVRLKGPERAMVYFCTRHIDQSPDDVDSVSLIALQEFKAEMRQEGLYREFKQTAEFEKQLYHHLDLKIKKLLKGELQIPGSDEEPEETIWWDNNAADKRLQQPVEFGSSIPDIASQFASRMDQFDREGGANDNKFLKLGEHAYRKVDLEAHSLKETTWLWFQSVMSPGITHSISRDERPNDNVEKLMAAEFMRSVAIVNWRGIAEFLELCSDYLRRSR